MLIGVSTTVSYYVDALWFDSLGFASVFWSRLNLQAALFALFALATFVLLYAAFRALKPARLGQLIGDTLYINQQPVKLPVEAVTC